MSFFRASGVSNIQMLPSAASTPLVANGLVTVTGGALAKSASTDSVVMGICLQTRASTDADYTTAKPFPVDLVGSTDILYCDNVTGTLTTGMVGQFLKLSSTAGVVADAGTATDTPAAGLVLICIGFISTTQGYFVLNGSKLTRGAA